MEFALAPNDLHVSIVTIVQLVNTAPLTVCFVMLVQNARLLKMLLKIVASVRPLALQHQPKPLLLLCHQTLPPPLELLRLRQSPAQRSRLRQSPAQQQQQQLRPRLQPQGRLLPHQVTSALRVSSVSKAITAVVTADFVKNALSALYFWIHLKETVTSVNVAPALAPQIHYFAIRDWTVSEASIAPRTKNALAVLFVRPKPQLMEYVTAEQESFASRVMIAHSTFTAALKMSNATLVSFAGQLVILPKATVMLVSLLHQRLRSLPPQQRLFRRHQL